MSSFRSFRRRFDALFGRVVLETACFLTRAVPSHSVYALATGLGDFLYCALYRQRRTAFAGLKRSFGAGLDHAARRRIVRGSFVAMAKSAVELLHWTDKVGLARRRIRLKNREVIDRALGQGKGVILVTAHFGNFPLILVKLALEGYKTSVIMRPIKELRLVRLFEAVRRNLDIETVLTVPRAACVGKALRSLRANRLMLIPLDQNFGTAGVFVDFFGNKAATATGPVVLARRTGAAIVPCFIIREPDDTHTVVFEPVFELCGGTGEREVIVDGVQRLTTIIESYIRRYPEQWTWIHRRWKAQPRTDLARQYG